MLKRLALLFGSLCFFVLVSEGVLSLFFDASWAGLIRQRSFLEAVAEPLVQTDAERFAVAVNTPGPYRIHTDPRVGYVLKSGAELELLRVTVHTDDLGLRARPGPAPAADAFRIVVLGDSVAFGWGLEDDEVLAVRLEQALRATRAEGEPEIVCRTVAVPSWNTKNAASFLLDHLDVLDPDLVLYMHVRNDVNDCFNVYETGHRRAQPDLCSVDPLVHVSENMAYLRRIVQRLLDDGIDLGEIDAGPDILSAGLSPTSSERIEGMADTLVHLQARLAEAGAPLILLPYTQHDLHLQLQARLAARGEALASIPLLEEIVDGDTLGFDPHPAAATTEALAIWTARSLVERSLVPRADGTRLPAVPARFEDRRTRELPRDELLAWRAAFERTARAALVPEIEHATGRGVRQIYGGVRLDGSMGPALIALLPPGKTLRVELAPRTDASSLQPLHVRVEIDGVTVGSLTLTDDPAPVAAEFTVPGDGTRPLEVRLEADRWALLPVLGRARLVSARFVSLSVSD